MKPYQVTISLGGIVGSEGVSVAGSNGTKRIEVTGGCSDEHRCDIAV